MPATDLATLFLPDWAVPTRSRRLTVRIREQWWRNAITSRQLPGDPPSRWARLHDRSPDGIERTLFAGRALE